MHELTFCLQPHPLANENERCAFGVRRFNMSGRDVLFKPRGSVIGTGDSGDVLNPIIFKSNTVS